MLGFDPKKYIIKLWPGPHTNVDKHQNKSFA